ncbi:hypothetical protein Tco_1023960, partial [Tanacetum coccineum]
MANTTPIVTTVMKTTTREKAAKETDATPRVNIQDFYEEHYEDILPVIMDKIHRDKRKEVHTRLDFGNNTKRSRRTRESSQNSSAGTWSARHRNPSEKPRVKDSFRDGNGNVFGRLGRALEITLRAEVVLTDGTLPRAEAVPEVKTAPVAGRSRIMKRGRTSESPLSRVSESGTSDGGRWKSASKSRKLIDEEDLAVPWTCEEVDPFTPRICNFKSSWKTRMPNNVKTYDGTRDLEDHRDEDTLEDFMKRFKVETGRIKGAPECMRISGFMHGVNNPKLTKRLNEHVPKTMEEMITVTMAFIRAETVPDSKKKGHAPWEPQDQSKRHVSERKSNFRGQSREGRGSNRFTPLTRMPKEILAVEAGKFKRPPPMVTPVEKEEASSF